MTGARARSARRILLTLACAGLMTAGCSIGNTTNNSNTNNGNCNAAGGTNSVGCSAVASASAAATVSSSTSSPASTPPTSASASAGKTWTETTFSGSKTFANFVDAGNPQGVALSPGQAVQVFCRVEGFAVADGDKWWYRIAPSPWNGRYYASADNFYNTPKPTGKPDNGVIVDKRVSLC